jgi:receptor-type tyrosine-protein phosphatase gamma
LFANHINLFIISGQDYINATFFPGFSQLNEFIITQHPLTDTFDAFWQMVYDHNSQTIVMLSSVIGEKNFPQFWPNKNQNEIEYQNFKLKLIEETCLVQESGNMITTRDLVLSSTQDDFELGCRIVHCAGWPETCGPLYHVFDLIKQVQSWHHECRYQNGKHFFLSFLLK